jgi:tetratricopeptide (TPR) repeat protein
MTLVAYWPLPRCDFINFDDPNYVLENAHVQAGLTWSGVAWAFRAGHASNWHPLTWLSHMLDCQIYGLKAGGHHATNLLFHLGDTLLLFFVLKRMTGTLWRSAFVAGLFALHPLHVESVAWIAERKDVLSTFFWFLTLWAYARYVGESKIQSPRARAYYALSLVLFALGLMSKPMLVTLPCLLLLLDYWPLRRFETTARQFDPSRLRPLFYEKLPFFALALAASVVTFRVQSASGAVRALDYIPLDSRLLNAIVAYSSYIQKMFWPADLSIHYLLPKSWPSSQLTMAAVLLAGISAAVIWLGRRPYLLVGWLWFLGTLVPVIGLVQVGSQAMADRYTYVPMIGLFLMTVWGVSDLTQGWRGGKMVSGLAGVLVITSCAVATRLQLQHWRNGRTVFEHALEVSPDNHIAHNNLGSALAADGNLTDAKAHYVEALRYYPSFPNALYNLARAQADQNQFEEAITNYQRALELQPEMIEALNNLAWIRAANPDARFRDGPEAVRLAERACDLSNYQTPVMIGTLAAAYAEAGRFPEAIKTAEKARALALAAGQDALAKKNLELLELYRSERAYRETPP